MWVSLRVSLLASGDCHGPGSMAVKQGYKIPSFFVVAIGQCRGPPCLLLCVGCLKHRLMVAEVGFKCLIFLPASTAQVSEFQVRTTAPSPVFIFKGKFSALPSDNIFPNVHFINFFEWIIFTWGSKNSENWPSLLGLWLKARIQKLFCTLKTKHCCEEKGGGGIGCGDTWLLWFEVTSAPTFKRPLLPPCQQALFVKPTFIFIKLKLAFFYEGTVSILGFVVRTISRTLLL